MFLENKYTKIYYQIINNAQGRINDGYVERHHIIPKCMGGPDIKSNIVSLTAREHFICHWLLIYMVDNKIHQNKLRYALQMFRCNNGNQKRNMTSAQYEIAKKQTSQANMGRRISNEHIEKMKIARLSKPAYNKGVPMSENQKDKLRGRKRTNETRRLISEARIKNGTSWNKGIPRTDNVKESISQAQSKTWEVIHPDGSSEIVFNLKKFCDRFGLSHSNLSATADKPNRSCKGFRVNRLEHPYIAQE